MTKDEFLQLMRFPYEWHSLGMYPQELFDVQVARYEQGDERGSEHDRNGAFHWWLRKGPKRHQVELLRRLATLIQTRYWDRTCAAISTIRSCRLAMSFGTNLTGRRLPAPVSCGRQLWVRFDGIMRAFILALSMLVPCFVCAAEPLTPFGISLLQPESVLAPRVQSVDALAAYIKAIEHAANDFLSTQPQRPPTTGFIVVAVRPGQQSRTWFDLKPGLPAQTANELKAAIARIQPLRVNGGAVVFAINVGIWGGPAATGPMPNPSEFAAAAKAAGRPLEVGDLVERIWND